MTRDEILLIKEAKIKNERHNRIIEKHRIFERQYREARHATLNLILNDTVKMPVTRQHWIDRIIQTNNAVVYGLRSGIKIVDSEV